MSVFRRVGISPSSSFTDRNTKAHEYGATPSIKRYVILEQRHIGATVFSRDLGQWMATVLPADAVLQLPEVGLSIPLTEFYEDVELAAPDDPAE